MKIKDIKLAATVFTPNELLEDEIPKVVFIGRSNVGKSSLINKLVNRKKLARTSSKPGKTLSINYYMVNEEIYFVDLPGYGYAKVSKTETQRCQKLIARFFETVNNVKLILVLIDSRRGFMDKDLAIMEQIVNKQFKLLTVLTKSDKLRHSELLSQKNNLKNNFGLKALAFTIKSENSGTEVLKTIEQALME
ncbi:MAG: YihA family ribosome biogenesis GTP-binding protein [bacterium]|nr:YihA family ribosome biogenesis GTP-binding protein [bacterium]